MVKIPQPKQKGYGLDFNIGGTLVEVTCKSLFRMDGMPDVMNFRTLPAIDFDVSLQDSVGARDVPHDARQRITESIKIASSDVTVRPSGNLDIRWDRDKGIDTLNAVAELLLDMEHGYLSTQSGRQWAQVFNPAGLIMKQLFEDTSLHLRDHLTIEDLKAVETALASTGRREGVLKDLKTSWMDMKHLPDQNEARRKFLAQVEYHVHEAVLPILETAQMPETMRDDVIKRLSTLVLNQLTGAALAR